MFVVTLLLSWEKTKSCQQSKNIIYLLKLLISEFKLFDFLIFNSFIFMFSLHFDKTEPS